MGHPVNVTAERTYDLDLIREIMFHPGIWETASEDGQEQSEFNPDIFRDCWLVILADGEEIGVYKFNTHNSVTVEAHANILPEYRSQFGRASGVAALEWLYRNAPGYEKVIAQIPVIYKNVLRFTREFGFKDEGVCRKSYKKNGQIVDRIHLGITRDEIRRLLDVQRS